ncbi:hypothetical protein HDU93_002847 [Gonapodya sp. JEL0774]|nr:hypothetical protein HDU93_002847 [Gonapodya sp. JEL0774]
MGFGFVRHEPDTPGGQRDVGTKIIMELLQGDTLRNIVAKGQVTLELAHACFDQLPRIMQEVHRLGWTHMNLTLANAMIKWSPRPTVVVYSTKLAKPLPHHAPIPAWYEQENDERAVGLILYLMAGGDYPLFLRQPQVGGVLADAEWETVAASFKFPIPNGKSYLFTLIFRIMRTGNCKEFLQKLDEGWKDHWGPMPKTNDEYLHAYCFENYQAFHLLPFLLLIKKTALEIWDAVSGIQDEDSSELMELHLAEVERIEERVRVLLHKSHPFTIARGINLVETPQIIQLAEFLLHADIDVIHQTLPPRWVLSIMWRWELGQKSSRGGKRFGGGSSSDSKIILEDDV